MSGAMWRPPPFDWQPSLRVLRETLLGGQAFRWKELNPDQWRGVWGDTIIELRWTPAGVEWCNIRDNTDISQTVNRYFAGETDFDQIADALPGRSDAVIQAQLDHWHGLRILRQPFGETLLAFLCSSVKRIPQIALMMEGMAAKFGQPIAQGIHRLPTWSELAVVGEAPLRATGLGYRAKYIHGTAQFLNARPGWLEATEALPYNEAKSRLLELPGVGEKIADCVLLFGTGKLEAFPVDTWVLKAMSNRYGLTGWRPEQVAQFGRVHFGEYAGYAQQVLFAGERSS